MSELLKVLVEVGPDGKPAFEELLVEKVGANQYRLEKSPGFVLNLAAGDVFELSDTREVSVLSRGGNLCIQVFLHSPDDGVEGDVVRHLEPLRGRQDGRSQSVLVFTVPVSATFPAIERALKAALQAHPSAQWYFGNVYDPADGKTPLDWWKPQLH